MSETVLKKDIDLLIFKYEKKIESINALLGHAGNSKEDIDRLKVRIYERNEFIKDLKTLTETPNELASRLGFPPIENM